MSARHRSHAASPHVARALLLLLVTFVMLLPSFALGEGPAAPLVPPCKGEPPGLLEPPPLPKPLVAGDPFTSQAAHVGVLPGAGSVSPTGEYVYRIPIEVPAGRAGMQPSLALVYHSRGRNGHLGVGWQLEGLSEINRCPKTVATEGVSAGIRFDPTDALCLDGQKLIAVRPFTFKDDGCNGTEYRTEDDVFARIASCELAHRKVDKFTVWLKDGRIREYTFNDVTSSDGAVVRFNWLLTSERDRAGNAIHYEYELGNNYHPTRIVYTFQEGQSPAPGTRSVEFEYDATASNNRSFRVLDESKATRTDVLVGGTGLLRGVKLIAPSAVDPSARVEAWRYDLSYGESEISGRSLLTKVQRCSSGGAACGLAKEFRWEKDAGTRVEHTIAGPRPASHPFVADLDGDGKDELLYDPGDGVHWLVSRSTVDPAAPLAEVREHLTPSTLYPQLVGAQVADIDGDGRAEIIAPDLETSGFVVMSLPGVGNTATPLLGESFQPGTNEPLFVVDLNGDGLPDLVRGAQVDPTLGWKTSSWSYRLNQGGSSFGPKVQVGVAGAPISDALGSYHFALVQDQGHHRATIFPAFKDLPGAGASEPWGFRLDANGVPQGQVVWSGPEGNFLRATADVDGDGIREAISFTITDEPPTYPGQLCADGLGCTKVHWLDPNSLDTYGLYDHSGDSWRIDVADMDADGREDVVLTFLPQGYPSPIDPELHAKSFSYKLDEAKHFYPYTEYYSSQGSWSYATFAPDAFGDFDGDGMLDVVRYDEIAGVWRVRLHSSGMGNNDRLIAVADEGDTSDPKHAREKVTYSLSWSPEPEHGQCAHPQRCMKQGFMTVREHAVYQGSESTSLFGMQYQRALYSYEDPRFDVHGRGFLGFRTVRQWEPSRGAETITTFDHETSVNGFYPYALKPKRIRKAVGIGDDNARIVQTDFTYEVRYLNGGLSHVVFPTGWSSYEWEEPVTTDADDSAKVHITNIDGLGDATHERDWRHRLGATVYDDYGNVLDTYSMTVGGVTTHAAATYEIREDDWLISLRTSQESTSASVPTMARRVEHDYDARGFLCHTYVEKNHPDEEIPEVVTYFRDADGLVRAVTSTAARTNARTTHIAYEPNDRVYPFQVWNDLGHTQAVVRDPASGVPLAQEDENGVLTRWQYDALGRPVSVRREGAAGVSTTYSPRVAGSGDVIGMTVEVADEAGGAERTDHDELGRVVGRRHKAFDGSWIHQAIQYDALGRVATVSRPGVGSPSNVVTRYQHDALDRPTQETRPSNEIVTSEIVTYHQTFFETAILDPMGHQRWIVRDLDGRIESVVEHTATTAIRTEYQYGDFGQLVRTTDPEGNDITAAYDVRGRRVSVSDPDAGLTHFYYNGLGDLTATVTNGAHIRRFTHDPIGRVTAVVDDDGTTAMTWDTAPNGIGRVSHTESPDSTRQDFEFDEYGRPRAETWTIDGQTYRFDRTYDALGRLRSLAYPEAPGGLPEGMRFQVTHDYNQAGYLRQVSRTRTMPNGTLVYLPPAFINIEGRNVDGSLTQATLGNGDLLTRTYNPDTGRLLTLKSGSALSLSYTYDLEGRVGFRDDAIQNHRDVFFYGDGSTHRLTGWLRVPASSITREVQYGYDKLGNLTQIDVNGSPAEIHVYGEDQRPHTLTSNQAGAYIYDDRGRQVIAPSRQVTYTEFDLPRTVTTQAGTTSFAYDAAQRRVNKVGPEGRTITLGGLYERRESNGQVKHVFYVQGPEGPVAQTVWVDGWATAPVEYLHLDALGSVGAVTDESGQVVDRLNYEPFGARQDAAGKPVTGPNKDVLLSFAGHRHDDDLGLIDMRGRVYDPANRRFLTPDPHVTDPLSSQSYNRYSYVVNNPINLTDPTGFDWFGGGCIGLECLGGGGIFGTGSIFSFGMGWGGPRGPMIIVGAGAGMAAPKTPSAAPVHASEHFRPSSLPIGPMAPSTSVVGPPIGLAWSNPFAADFYQQVKGDLAELIAFNYMMWQAHAPEREVWRRWAEGHGNRAFFEMWRKYDGETGPVPFEVIAERIREEDEMIARALGSVGSIRVVGAAAEVVGASKAIGLLPAARATELGGGRIWSHFTNAEGATGITGIVARDLAVGQRVVVGELRFAYGVNDYMAKQAGDVFVTTLGAEASAGALHQIGVFGAKQQFLIQFSEEAAFLQGVRVSGAAAGSRGIYSFPGGTNMQGNFTLQRLW